MNYSRTIISYESNIENMGVLASFGIMFGTNILGMRCTVADIFWDWGPTFTRNSGMLRFRIHKMLCLKSKGLSETYGIRSQKPCIYS